MTTTSYPFHVVRNDETGPLSDAGLLRERPFSQQDRTFAADARYFVPSESMLTAINVAVAIGEPLLITGEPGTGKTQTAYYVAYKLGIEPVIHFQVKSDTSAHDLLYHFDAVRYFHDANLRQSNDGSPLSLEKTNYVEPRAMWQAFTAAAERNTPCVLLIDEIDKAPRDFPNDLLHELDKMEFTVVETGQLVTAPRNLAPIVLITSNSERRLPEAFLRRCVYHHIRFDDMLAKKAIESRLSEYSNLSTDFIAMALDRFLRLRERSMRKLPSTSELLVWLRVLSLATGTYPPQLEHELNKLPFLEVLIKDRQDLAELGYFTVS